MTLHTVVGVFDPVAHERGFVAVKPELTSALLASVMQYDAVRKPRETSADESVLPLGQYDRTLPLGAENPYERYTPDRVNEAAAMVARIIRMNGHEASVVEPLTMYTADGPIDGVAFEQ